MHPALRFLWFALLLVPASFPVLGISGSGIEYQYDGSRFSAVVPACAINAGSVPVEAAVRSSDPCIRAVFAGGLNETEIAPGGEECIGLELACDANATSLDLTVVSASGMVRGGVVRTARVSYKAAAVLPGPAPNASGPQASGFLPAPGNGSQNQSAPQNATAGDKAANPGGDYAIVLILVIVISSVSAWCLTKYHYRR